MTSESRDYFRGDAPSLRFEGWAGTPVTWTLILVHSVLWFVYAGTVYRVAPHGTLHGIFRDELSLTAVRVVEDLRLWQPLTYFFLHPPGSILSGVYGLIYTLAFLFFLGRPLERMLGRRSFLGLYVTGGVVSGLLAVPWTYLLGREGVPIAHAGGAVYAVSIGCLLRMPAEGMYFGVPGKGVAIFLVILHAALAAVIPDGEVFSFFNLVGAGIGWAHLRAGPRLAAVLERRGARREAKRDARQAETEAERRRRVDDLLAKIQAEGIGALSPQEKDFLQEASRRFR